MDRLVKEIRSKQRGAALIIVLAFVVLFAGLAVAYLSRTTSDRQIANSSFNQSNVDQLVQSAVDNIIGDLRQEITNGSTAVTQDGTTLYMPTAAANMVAQRSGNAAGASNLIRRSVREDPIPAPGRPSRASAVNSQNDFSANGRSISSTRWNSHYLIPKGNTATEDASPIPAFTDATPDWVFVTDAGATVITSPSSSVIGRYSYAVYAEGGLLDMNVAGYPTDAVISTATIRPGRKGSAAYADLTALGSTDPSRFGNPDAAGVYQGDRLVGWRNYATTQPSNNFPDTGTQAFAKNFQTDTSATRPATAFYNYVLNNSNGFLNISATPAPNGRTNQAFIQRQQLIAFRKTVGSTTSVSANVLQYLGTFSRETNAPSFSPSTPAGSTIDYAALASNPDAVNPNFLLRGVTTSFNRFEGMLVNDAFVPTPANPGEPLVKTRFPLARLAWITYKGPSASRTLPPESPTLPPTDPNYDTWALQWVYGIPASYLKAGTAANVKACFGLTFQAGGGGGPGSAWTYTNPAGTTAASRILRLDEVAAAAREPDFFELLQAGILSGSLGQNTGGGVTGGNVFPDVHMSNSAHHILSIGAAIIDQADPDSIPMRIHFSPSGTLWTAYGVENLPYITQMYPITGTSPNTPSQWATYLTFQLWNPHQNAPTAGYPVSVRLRVDGAVGIFKGGNGESWVSGTTPQIIANGNTSGQSVTLISTFSFSAPAPLTNVDTTGAAAAPGPAAGGAFAVLAAPSVLP
jgi:hypothetical protein